jgi:3-oxoacyl-[acyl-carrier-protein] synthase-1
VHGVSKAEILETIHRDKLPVCEIKSTNNDLAQRSGMKENLPRTTYLSALAAQEALQQAKLPMELNNYRTGFISGNTVGGMDLTEHFYKEFLLDEIKGHLREALHHECGSITELVAQHLGFQHYVTTFSTACSSSANSLMQAARMIQANQLDIVLAGGCDALCKFTLNGFNTLMILDSEPCKPFDKNRKGLNLGEGAAYLLLVSDDIKTKFQLQPIAQLIGYANANDAYHQTASSAEGVGNYLAMEGALKQAGLAPSDIQYINAHGTGTANNDSSECIAIERLFQNAIPLFSSTKGNTGHTLGACGALEAVFSCLSLQHQQVYPSLRFQEGMEETNIRPVTELSNCILNHVMSNSFGFGGNCSSLIFSKA